MVQMTVAEKVVCVSRFFSTRLLLKRFRQGVRDEATVPSEVRQCEAAFAAIVVDVARATARGEQVDALGFAERCSDFSQEWIDCSHWVSPRKLRQFMAENIGARWANEDAVPAHFEEPPKELKQYKADSGPSVQPCICPLCKVVCNSLQQYQAHTRGRTHRSLLRRHAKKTKSKIVEPIMLPPRQPADAAEAGAEAEVAAELEAASAGSAMSVTPSATPATEYYTLSPYAYAGFGALEPPRAVPEEFARALEPKQQLPAADVPTASDIDDDDDDELDDLNSTARSTATLASSVQPRRQSAAVLEALDRLSFLLAVRAEGVAAAAIEVCALAADEAPLEVAAALVDSALVEEAAGELAAVVVDVMDALPALVPHLQHVVTEMVVQAAPPADDAAQAPDAQQWPAGLTDLGEEIEARTRSKWRALARFVSELVHAGVLGAVVLQRCIERLMSTHSDKEALLAIALTGEMQQAYPAGRPLKAMRSSISDALSNSAFPMRVAAAARRTLGLEL